MQDMFKAFEFLPVLAVEKHESFSPLFYVFDRSDLGLYLFRRLLEVQIPGLSLTCKDCEVLLPLGEFISRN